MPTPTRDDNWFRTTGLAYDCWGVLRFALPVLRQRPGEWFCSEAVAAMLGMGDGDGVTPGDLWEVYACACQPPDQPAARGLFTSAERRAE